MAGPRLVVAVICLTVTVAGAGVAAVQVGRMAIVLRAIEGRPRPFWQPAFLVWRDYARACPGGPYLRGISIAAAMVAIGILGFTLSLA
jgi:hypothetical protein